MEDQTPFQARLAAFDHWMASSEPWWESAADVPCKSYRLPYTPRYSKHGDNSSPRAMVFAFKKDCYYRQGNGGHVQAITVRRLRLRALECQPEAVTDEWRWLRLATE